MKTNWSEILGDADADHEITVARPKMQRDTDTLHAMFTSFDEAIRSGITLTRVQAIMEGGKSIVQRISDDMVAVSIEGGSFRGVAMCPACCRKAAMMYRDAADHLERIAAEAERFGGESQ